ncbi:hypothetical protein JHK86_009931 [Glycine max]|nr:hypothetical protein JHK86_009931 [Glycine max]
MESVFAIVYCDGDILSSSEDMPLENVYDGHIELVQEEEQTSSKKAVIGGSDKDFIDKEKVLTEGLWLIHDHYLIVRDWSPNFHPQTKAIEKVVAWVRILGLPIEFYDAKVLYAIGDRIGRTMRVDRNTISRERGKYAIFCVEVDLTKPLLAL